VFLPPLSSVRYTRLIVWPTQEDNLDIFWTAAAVFTRVVDKDLYARKINYDAIQLQFTQVILIQVRTIQTKNLFSLVPSIKLF
jgi:hypothetical protein